MYALRRAPSAICRRRQAVAPNVNGHVHGLKGLPFAARRHEHTLRTLPYDIDQGMGDFLSPSALKVVAEDYQSGLLERLNEETQGTQFQTASVAQTIISAGSDPKYVLAFNYASQALNNSFFLDNLKQPHNASHEGASNHEVDISSELLDRINNTFGSIDQLKSSMSAAALGMMGSGWVWLVTDATANQLAYVPSYGPGTMLVRSRQHRHPEGLSDDPIPQRFAVLGEPIEPSNSNDLSEFMKPTKTSSSSKTREYQPVKGGPLPEVGTRSFHSSAINLSPLFALRRQAPRAIQLSQTPLPLPPLEPLSKQNSASPYSTQGKQDDGISFDDDLAEAGSGTPNPTSRPFGSNPYSAIHDRHMTLLSSRSMSANWTSNRWRGEGDDLTPLFCISVHEHAWMTDYGVWGKEEYLKRFWTVLDWGKVSHLYERWRQVASSGPSRA